MKKLIVLLLALFLCGCAAKKDTENASGVSQNPEAGEIVSLYVQNSSAGEETKGPTSCRRIPMSERSPLTVKFYW